MLHWKTISYLLPQIWCCTWEQCIWEAQNVKSGWWVLLLKLHFIELWIKKAIHCCTERGKCKCEFSLLKNHYSEKIINQNFMILFKMIEYNQITKSRHFSYFYNYPIFSYCFIIAFFCVCGDQYFQRNILLIRHSFIL